MNAKDILAKVKGLFDAPVVVPPVAPVAPVAPAALATPVPTPFKLLDGSDITISIADPAVSATPSVGDMAMIAGAPAPAADYTLEDGSVLTVDSTGAISLIVAPQPITQPDFAAPPALTLEDRIAAIEAKISAPAVAAFEITANESFASVQALVKEHNTKLATYLAKIEKQDGIISGLFELVEKLVDEPSAPPKTLSDNQKAKFERVSRKDERLAKIAEQIKTQKALS